MKKDDKPGKKPEHLKGVAKKPDLRTLLQGGRINNNLWVDAAPKPALSALAAAPPLNEIVSRDDEIADALKALDFVRTTPEELQHRVELATTLNQRDAYQGLYTAAALANAEEGNPLRDKLMLLLDKLAENQTHIVFSDAQWADIGFDKLMTQLETLRGDVREIRSIEKQNAKFQENAHKGATLKQKNQEESDRAVEAIRREKIAPAMLEFFRKHHLVLPGKLDGEAINELMTVSKSFFEPLVHACFVEKNGHDVMAAIKRRLTEQPAQASDAALIAPLEEYMNDLSERVQETGRSESGSLRTGLIHMFSAMPDYRQYAQHFRAAEGVSGEAVKINLLKEAMKHHEAAFAHMAEAMANITPPLERVVSTIDANNLEQHLPTTESAISDRVSSSSFFANSE